MLHNVADLHKWRLSWVWPREQTRWLVQVLNALQGPTFRRWWSRATAIRSRSCRSPGLASAPGLACSRRPTVAGIGRSNTQTPRKLLDFQCNSLDRRRTCSCCRVAGDLGDPYSESSSTPSSSVQFFQLNSTAHPGAVDGPGAM